MGFTGSSIPASFAIEAAQQPAALTNESAPMRAPDDTSTSLPRHVRAELLEELDAELRHADVLGAPEEAPAAAGGHGCRGIRVSGIGLDHAEPRDAGAREEIRRGAADDAATDDRYVVARNTHRLTARARDREARISGSFRSTSWAARRTRPCAAPCSARDARGTTR